MNNTQISFAKNQGPRENLEDDFIATQIALHPFGTSITSLCIFDGVGGNRHGEVASQTGRETVNSYLSAYFAGGRREMVPSVTLDILIESLKLANQAVIQHGNSEPELRGMATTVVATVILDGILYAAWAGDSRCYLYNKENGLKQITNDHSEVQRLVDAGLIHPDKAKDHPLAHTIYRFLGQKGSFQADTTFCRLSPQDIILLCTDGLTDVVSDEEIATTINACLKKRIPFEHLPSILVQQALDAQTRDNVSVLCCQYKSALDKPTDLTVTGAYSVTLAQTLQNHFKE